MTKEEILEKYATKIVEVAYHNFPLVYPKETVIKCVDALIIEHSDQQTKEIKEECVNWSLACDKLELKNKELQERVEELEKAKEDSEAVNSEQIIKWIAQRIKDEQRKHSSFDENWHEIAARKIYASYNITLRNI